jgi:RNA polymerase sigma-70 factor (ECF subfamily)
MQVMPGIGVVSAASSRLGAYGRACAERPPGYEVDALFAAHADELRRYAQRIVRTRDAAEDVVQEVFLRLWLTRDRVAMGAAMRSYLFVSTRSRALDAVKRARREAREAVDDAVPACGERLDEDAGVVVPPDDAAIAGAVVAVLGAMPPRQRLVATMRLCEHRSTAEVARALGISPRTVESHLARATRALRAELPGLLGSER